MEITVAFTCFFLLCLNKEKRFIIKLFTTTQNDTWGALTAVLHGWHPVRACWVLVLDVVFWLDSPRTRRFPLRTSFISRLISFCFSACYKQPQSLSTRALSLSMFWKQSGATRTDQQFTQRRTAFQRNTGLAFQTFEVWRPLAWLTLAPQACLITSSSGLVFVLETNKRISVVLSGAKTDCFNYQRSLQGVICQTLFSVCPSQGIRSLNSAFPRKRTGRWTHL